MPKISVNALKTVVAISKTKDFVGAASILNKVPTAVSYTLNNLEATLDVKLFSRVNKKLEPTAAGRYLIAKADVILSDLTTCENTLQRISHNFEDKINIAVNNIININPILDIIKESLEQFPLTQIELLQEVHNGVWDSLITNRSQIAIGAPNEPLVGTNINSFVFGQVDWLFCVSAHHELCQMKQPLSNELLRKYSAICIQDTAKNLSPKNAWLLEGQNSIYVPTFYNKICAQIKGIGIGFIPSFMAKEFIDKKQLVVLQVEDVKPPTQLSMAWNINDNHGPCATFWKEKLQDQKLHHQLLKPGMDKI